MNKVVNFIRRILGTKEIINWGRKINTIQNAMLFRGVIENCEWLKYKSFAPGGWAMDNAGLYTLFHILNNMKPQNILELGLGESSKLIHQYAHFFSNVKALTIEHNANWINFFSNGITGIPMNIELCNTETLLLNGFETLRYERIFEHIMGNNYDFIVVDGPFGSDYYSRSDIIDIVRNGLPERFCIFMDDTERTGEKQTIEQIIKILNARRIDCCKHEYTGEKNCHTIICSSDLIFLTTLR